MAEDDSPSSSGFPAAGQANLIRAEQKDEVYLQQLTEACHDSVRRLLGPGKALQWSRETRVLAELLYYGCTTGSGLQTLGEEYCDVVQASGALGSAPGALQRGTLTLVQALGPYALQRLAAPADEEAAAWQRMRQAAQRTQRVEQTRGLGARAAAVAARLRAGAAALAARPVVTALMAAAREHGGTLLRCHLALFYIYGIYYRLPKRLAGVRYLFAGRGPESGPTYRTLGYLLLAQLGISGALALLARYGALRGGAGVAGGRRAAHAVLRDAAGAAMADPPPRPAASAASGADSVADVAPHQRCPLCLSPRTAATAAPCGHVFCWTCVAEWAAQKPECPLCRADCPTSSLVCIAHADF